MCQGQGMDDPGSRWRGMAAWYRLLERLPAWLGLMLCAAVMSAVLAAFFGLRAGTMWHNLIPVWSATFIATYLGMVALAIVKGYHLREPPKSNWGKNRDCGSGREHVL